MDGRCTDTHPTADCPGYGTAYLHTMIRCLWMWQPVPEGRTMDDDEFRRRYHAYQTDDEDAAYREAVSVTLADGGHPIVVGLPFGATVRYCLMLPRAAELIHQLHPEGAEEVAHRDAYEAAIDRGEIDGLDDGGLARRAFRAGWDAGRDWGREHHA